MTVDILVTVMLLSLMPLQNNDYRHLRDLLLSYIGDDGLSLFEENKVLVITNSLKLVQ